MTHFKEKPKVYGGPRLRAQLSRRLGLLCTAVLLFTPLVAAANFDPEWGTIRGKVTLGAIGLPLRQVTVLIVQLGRTTETNEKGFYQFNQVPPGAYDIFVTAPALADERHKIQIGAGDTVVADFRMRLMPIRESITVTASGHEQTSIESFQATSVLDSIQLVEKSKSSLGEVLNGQPGVAKRDFGPGNSRPVIRGFDGDRVLIMKDGISTGTLSSQSGDHGETLNPLNLDRLEVVKGPATLLYGSNAIGGVVNAITPQGETQGSPHTGLSAYLTGVGGTTNGQAGGAAGLRYGLGRWVFWADAGGQCTSNYDTPLGDVYNSWTHLLNGSGGFGWSGEKSFSSLSFGYESSGYGIPPVTEEVVHLALHRSDVRFIGGFHDLESFISGFRVTLDYSAYHHEELSEENTPNTIFDNRLFSYRGVFDQRKTGPLTGIFGFSGFHRDYESTGEEAISPPLNQDNAALFTLQKVNLKLFRLQFGGRVDYTAYGLKVQENPGVARNRDFTGLSGAVGINVPLWTNAAFVANYTHSYRAPALEELYNNGPHPGNATFEIGNTNLKRERSAGLDLALRFQPKGLHWEADFFYYSIDNFVFLAPTGHVRDGLIEAEYLQGASRFIGGEASLDVGLTDFLWLLTGMDYVDAQLTRSVTSRTTGLMTPAGTPLPRIPPLRGRFGLDLHLQNLSLRPEAVAVHPQDRFFPTEARTAGSVIFNFNASYTIAGQHAVHVFSVSAFNLGNQLYRNHLSFIKDIAPEIGRGVRLAYTVRFF
jgi:iron complex outermembrane receptor protein